MSNATNNDVLPASMMAAVLIAVAVAGSTLVAKQPDRPAAKQRLAENVINNADQEAIADDVKAPIYGLTLEKRGENRPYVAAVEPSSRPWKAGLREGDVVVAVNDIEAEEVPYDEFIEKMRDVAAATYEGDSFQVTFERKGHEREVEMPGAGRSPEDLRDLQARSEAAIAEKLEDDRPSDQAAEPSTATTEELEAYVELATRAQEGALTPREQRRLNDLGTVVLGTGWLGGTPILGGAYTAPAASPTGSSWYWRGAGGESVGAFGGMPNERGQRVPSTEIGAGEGAGKAAPGSGIGDAQGGAAAPLSNRLGDEMTQLEQMQANGGQLTADQTRRLTALRQLSEYANQNAAAGSATPGRLTPTELQAVQRAAQAGSLSPAQQRTLLQIQRTQLMSAVARSRPGSNPNLPNGGAAAQGANRNLPNGVPATQGVQAGGGPVGGAAVGAGSGIGKAE